MVSQEGLVINTCLLFRSDLSSGTKIKKAAEKVEYLKPKQWETLQQEDLRFIHSQ